MSLWCAESPYSQAFLHGRRAKAEGCRVVAGRTYGVASGEFFLGANDSSATLSLVDCSLSSDHGLALRGASAGLAPDLGNRVPIV